MPLTDIRVKDIAWRTEEFRYRTPIKFGGVALDRVTLLDVTMTVESRDGKVATGFGSMPLGNVWAWPSKALSYDQTLGEMIELAAHCQRAFLGAPRDRHPVEIGHVIEKYLRSMAVGWHVVRKLPEPIPILTVLVVASAFDAALHDAYGRMLGLNCYRTYGPQFLESDLGEFLGKEFAGETLDRYVLPEPKPTMPLYHLVGALDPFTQAEVNQPVADGLPETLGEWIVRDGLTHLKIKLNGDDLTWDVDRVVAVNRVAEETAANRDWHYSLDFNERCRDVGYLLAFLDLLKEKSPRTYDRVQYIEQPTTRDLRANPNNRMHDAAKRKPVVIDESLVDLESLYLARDMGYSGVAFKACKGQTQTLLLAAAAQKMGLFRCVQDLTCPGASLIHSAGIAAHIPGVAAIEANARQYCPAANAEWDTRYTGLFTIRNGVMQTGQLNGVGLSLEGPLCGRDS